jgi:hypothetical protein
MENGKQVEENSLIGVRHGLGSGRSWLLRWGQTSVSDHLQGLAATAEALAIDTASAER